MMMFDYRCCIRKMNYPCGREKEGNNGGHWEEQGTFR